MKTKNFRIRLNAFDGKNFRLKLTLFTIILSLVYFNKLKAAEESPSTDLDCPEESQYNGTECLTEDFATDGFSTNFNWPNGTVYDKDECTSDMGECWYWLDRGNSTVDNNQLKIKFTKGVYGTDCGIQGKSRLNGASKYTLEYKIKFDDQFDWGLGGKLPGLCGGTAPTGGANPDGSGFSTRFMWREDGKLYVYAYWIDKVEGDWGDNWYCNFEFTPKTWHTIRQTVTVNTGNNYNGKVEVWVDGVLRLTKSGLRLMTSGNTVDLVSWDVFMGGNDSQWAPDHTQYLRIDDAWAVKGGVTETADDVLEVSAPTSVTQGETVKVDVKYSVSTERDIYVKFEKDTDPWTKYGEARVKVSKGNGTVSLNVPISRNAPAINDGYQFQTMVTKVGGDWDEKLDYLTKTNIDCKAISYPNVISFSGQQPENPASNIVDGKSGDGFRWSAENFPQWLVIDYGESKTMRGINLYTHQNRAYQYKIEASNSPSSGFFTIVNKLNNTSTARPIKSTFSPVNARYLKLTVNGAINYNGNWVSIDELHLIEGGTIDIAMRGSCGNESIRLLVNDTEKAVWNNIGSNNVTKRYNGYHGGDIKVEFFNDGISNGCDRNVLLDYISVNGVVYQTESSAIRTGCGNTQWLWCNGNFDFGNASTRTKNALIQNSVTLFPNPVKDELNIESTGLLSITIYNVQGKKVFSKQNLSDKETLDLKALSPGIYLVETINNKNINETKRIVKI